MSLLQKGQKTEFLRCSFDRLRTSPELVEGMLILSCSTQLFPRKIRFFH